VIPTPLVIPIPPGEVTVEVARRKAGTAPLAATDEATVLTAATNKVVMAVGAVVVKAVTRTTC